ncbi:hypothetical protein BHE97_17110 [Aeromicrobium sp. PE09-221]|uniref:CHAT domain-containing protein n=1 Tax=Aeromicrobium sp. PE09-221 TaxID=1898043 RepID=UPI000B3EB6EE|nr:CHAT domain-containing protein [Aeromicrobium sp. PE09-221]OUZ07230.1 hypothetical protein BHE97_17110 [Aeromicrobium sp. PE09-221]
MSASQYRSQLERKRNQRLAAEKKAGEFRSKESTKRAEAGRARLAGAKTKSDTTRRSKQRQADNKEREAETAGKEAARWQKKASTYAKEEAALASKLARAESAEADAAERQRKQVQQRIERQAIAEHATLESRVADTELAVEHFARQLRQPKQEKLRVLILGASAEGDLRLGREQKRIRAAVESALHRDQIELDVRPAATTADLLEGLAKFRPHVVHFSGHSNENLIVFEDDHDGHHEGVIVTAKTFAKAIDATDDPPVLVLLNSCNSAAQIDDLVAQVVPFAIGMAGTIDDSDAISYAAQFYATIANGQSIRSAHLSAQVALEAAGLDSAELPTLAWAQGVEPGDTVLVKAPKSE